MQTITSDAVVIGVDTHKDVHVAVALSGLGARLGDASAPATADGYRSLADWARGHGAVHAFGVEGTGSYGAGLSRALATQGFRVIEVNRPNRQLRRQRGPRATPSTPRPPPALSWPAKRSRRRNPATARSR